MKMKKLKTADNADMRRNVRALAKMSTSTRKIWS